MLDCFVHLSQRKIRTNCGQSMYESIYTVGYSIPWPKETPRTNENINIRTTSCRKSYQVIYIYTITWLLCEFSLVVDHDLLKDTHTDDVKSTPYHVSALVFLFSCPKNPSINHLNFYCVKQIDNIFPCVCTVIDHRRRHNV